MPPRARPSAGAGKTTRIVGDIAREVEIRQPEEIVGTTFTVKAADELIERSRANLFKSGKAEQAARLLGALFGTVNSICGQIVGEHAIELGRSPRAEVMPEDGVARLFAIAADTAIETHAPQLNALAEAMPSGAANTLVAGTDGFPARVSPMAVDDVVAPSVVRPAFVRLTRQIRDRPALHRRPSSETTTDPYVVVERVQLGPRLPFVGTPDMLSLGEAVHAIFAADALTSSRRRGTDAPKPSLSAGASIRSRRRMCSTPVTD